MLFSFFFPIVNSNRSESVTRSLCAIYVIRHFVSYSITMGDHQEDQDELLDYEEEDVDHDQTGNGAEAGADAKKAVKGSYVSIHSSGFRDFLLKPELLRAIVDCGFEHPSEGERA